MWSEYERLSIMAVLSEQWEIDGDGQDEPSAAITGIMDEYNDTVISSLGITKNLSELK
jgi:hypothetical protein